MLKFHSFMNAITTLYLVSYALRYLFPPPYLRKVYDYKNSNLGNIQGSLGGIDWDFLSQNSAAEKKV